VKKVKSRTRAEASIAISERSTRRPHDALRLPRPPIHIESEPALYPSRSVVDLVYLVDQFFALYEGNVIIKT
jgi:hypothetical protein